MIWAGRIIGVLLRPTSLSALAGALIGGFVMYHAGEWVGHMSGVADQKAAQRAADDAHKANIRERVKNALDEIGADAGDDDVDRVLRGLANQ